MAAAATQSAHILVVEDEGIVAKDVTSSLTRLGYTVVGVATSGEEAVQMVADAPPDLILMDIVLRGEVDGIDAAVRIHEQYDIPVVYLTAYADGATLERAKESVPYGYLLKPWQERELSTVIEIALHKHRIEKKQKESERWLGMTLASIADAVVATNEKGTVILMNAVAERLTGWRVSEAMGRDATEVVRIQGAGVHPLTRALTAKEPLTLGEEFRLLARDGRVVAVADSAAPIKDPRGHVKGAVLVFRDVTEALPSAARADAEWPMSFDAIQSPVLVLEFSGRIVRLNAAAQQVADRDYEGCAGLAIADLGPQQPWARAAALVEEVVRRQAAGQAQVQDPVTGHTWDIASNIWSAPGQEPRVIVMATDISRLVELQASLREGEAVSMGALVAGVAQEARDPLFGISANLDSLEARADRTGEERHAVQHMRQALNRLTGLMQQLLEYGKPLARELRPGSLADVIADAVDACGLMAERAQVVVECPPAFDLPPVRMDRQRLVHLFESLVENAIQHSPREERVVLEAEIAREEDGVWVECRVSDRGPGFGAGDTSRLFEPFVSRRRGGTGLGLAIAQRIVQEHEGRIETRNRPGGGAVMVVRLPLVG